MGSLVAAGKSSELSEGAMKGIVLEGHEILLARVGDKYYAVGNRCPHLGGKLSQGKLEGTVVTCPRHGSQFDLSDGQVVRWTNWSGLVSAVSKALKPPKPIKTYRVEVKGGSLFVEI